MLIEGLTPNKTDYCIARNIVAQKQFRDIASSFLRHTIRFMPLKGIALLDILYKNIGERFISDIDLLVRPEDMMRIHSLMAALGYDPISETPSGWMPKDRMQLPVDLHSDIWYLSKRELQRIWEVSPVKLIAGYPCQVLPREEMMVYTVAHAFVHHGYEGGAWRDDFLKMLTVWKDEIDIKNLMVTFKTYNMTALFSHAFELIRSGLSPAYAREIELLMREEKKPKEVLLKKFFSVKHNLKGHVLRFLFQRNLLFQIKYAFSSFFPGVYFMKRRYNVKTNKETVFLYIIRPFTFLLYTFRVIKKALSRAD